MLPRRAGRSSLHPTEHVPVSAYGASSKNLKDLKKVYPKIRILRVAGGVYRQEVLRGSSLINTTHRGICTNRAALGRLWWGAGGGFRVNEDWRYEVCNCLIHVMLIEVMASLSALCLSSDTVSAWVHAYIAAVLVYRGTSLTRKRTPLGPYRRPMPRVLGGS